MANKVSNQPGPVAQNQPISATPDQTALEYILPINRSGMAIAAGYMALFAILIFPAPIAFGLGILALVDLKKRPHLKGKGRAWFAVIFGGLMMIIPLVIAFIA